MANVQKYTRANVSGGSLTRHFERATDENDNYHKWGNQDIDPSRSHLNYNLAPERDKGQMAFIGERLSEVRCHKRGDVNVMCSWAITAPKELDPSEHRKFFEESYKFLNEKYGKGTEKNVVSAYVHMDEKSPHMHYAFIPVVSDKKKGIEKVSAKESLDYAGHGYSKFHAEYSARMTQAFGRDIGVLNEATKEGNKTVDELKHASQVAERAKLQEDVITLENNKNALQGKIAALEDEYKGKVLNGNQISQIKPEKSMMGSVKNITVEDVENLKRTAFCYVEAERKLENMTRECNRLQRRVQGMEKQIPSMFKQVAEEREKQRLQEIEKAFSRLPKEVQEQLLPSKTQSQDMGRSR